MTKTTITTVDKIVACASTGIAIILFVWGLIMATMGAFGMLANLWFATLVILIAWSATVLCFVIAIASLDDSNQEDLKI